LSEELYYKPGSNPAIQGRDEVLKYLKHFFHTFARFTGHDVRQVYEAGNAVAIEMDAFYTRHKDGKKLVIACTDIYRLKGNRIQEWRVYADVMPIFMNGLGE
jgi:limonene-1,2-epoxide hydrolase